MTSGIDSNTTFEVADDEGAIQLLINIKSTEIRIETDFPFQNIPHYTSLVFCETNIIYYQYQTKVATYHYL